MAAKFHKTLQTLPDTLQRLLRESVKDLSPRQVLLFGSQARGNARKNSDFDICFKDANPDRSVRAAFRVRLDEEAITLHKVDLVFWDELNDDYKKNIQAEGKLIYGD